MKMKTLLASRQVPLLEPVGVREAVLKASSPTTPRSLEEALALYEDAASDHPARVKIRSAFRTVGIVLGEPLNRVPACPEALRPLLAKANPAVVGVKPRQWRDVRYITKRGLRDLGVEVINDRDVTPLGPAWAELFGALPDRRLQIGLAKFMRYCTRVGIEPERVGPSHFKDFLQELETQSLHRDPEGVYRQTVRLWNKAAAGAHQWPPLIVPIGLDPRNYALPTETFPKAFRDDLDRFLSAGEIGDELDDGYAPRVRAITTKGRRHMILRLASAVVQSGVPAAEIHSLGVLCQLEHARAAMRFFRARHPQKAVTEGMLNHVWLLCVVARAWVGDNELEQVLREEIIRKYDRDVKAARSGVRLKNKQKLRQFDRPENLAALVDLPGKIFRDVARSSPPTYAQSVRLMYALMITILLHAPIRSKNLVELDFAQNIVTVGKGRGRVVRLQLPPSMTKTRRAYEAPLPQEILPLLDAWLGSHRSRVCPFPSPYLFPNPRGQLRNRDGLAVQLTGFIERETGLRMNMHLFRHLAVKIILEHDPSHMEVARQILGHSSRRITERAYAEFRADSSFDTYSAALDKIRTNRPKGGPPPRGRGR